MAQRSASCLCLCRVLAPCFCALCVASLVGYLVRPASVELASIGLRLPVTSNCSSGRSRCHAGFCDQSIGHCVCLPGWSGVRCEIAHLGACRMDVERGLSAPCEGFAGVMSCQCRRDCAAVHAVHGVPGCDSNLHLSARDPHVGLVLSSAGCGGGAVRASRFFAFIHS